MFNSSRFIRRRGLCILQCRLPPSYPHINSGFFFYEGVEDHEVIIAIIVHLFTNMCRYSISSEYTLQTSNYAIQIQYCCSENVKKNFYKLEGYIYFYG